MYKIIGSDGREYGPATLDQLKQWIQEGRVNSETKTQQIGAVGWKRAAEHEELKPLFPPPVVPTFISAQPPPPLAGVPQPQSGLAITSFVLGLLAMLCFGLLTGIPAIICGHVAYRRTRQAPDRFGGSGLAIAGFVMGYFSVAITIFLIAILVPAFTSARQKAESVRCADNLKQIGLTFRVWALDHDDQFPWNVSTNSGGTLESRDIGPDGFDRNPAAHIRALAWEHGSPSVLTCPSDRSKHPAQSFESLEAQNISYKLRTGPQVTETNPEQVMAVCPIHNNVLHCDGSVQRKDKSPGKPWRRLKSGSQTEI